MFGLVSGIRRHLDDEHAVPVGRLDVREKRKNINGEKIKHDKKEEEIGHKYSYYILPMSCYGDGLMTLLLFCIQTNN